MIKLLKTIFFLVFLCGQCVGEQTPLSEWTALTRVYYSNELTYYSEKHLRGYKFREPSKEELRNCTNAIIESLQTSPDDSLPLYDMQVMQNIKSQQDFANHVLTVSEKIKTLTMRTRKKGR